MRNATDTKELTALIENSAGSFAFACDTLAQVSALFSALIKFLPEHGNAHQLALLGEDLCDDRADVFSRMRDDYNAHFERFTAGGAHE